MFVHIFDHIFDLCLGSIMIILSYVEKKLFKGQTRFRVRDTKLAQTFLYGTARPLYSNHQLLCFNVQWKRSCGQSKLIRS